MIRLELGLTEAGQRRVGLDLALVGIVFAAAAGIGGMIPADAWPPGLILLLILASVPALRAAEARGGAASRRSGRRRCTWWRSRRSPPRSACCSCPAWWARPSWRWASMPGAARPRRWTTAHPGGRSILEFGALAVLGLVVALLLYVG